MKRKQTINMHIFTVFENSGGLYRNRNPNSVIETFYMVSCDNFKQLRIKCLIYVLQIINSSGLHAVQR